MTQGIIYQLTFSDGTTYIGMTNRTVELAMADKLANPSPKTKLGRKLITGMEYTSQTLCKPLGGVLLYEVWRTIAHSRKPVLNQLRGRRPNTCISLAMSYYNPMDYVTKEEVLNAIKSGS